MLKFLEYWSALLRPPLLGWALGAQLLAAATAIALHFVSWKARRHAIVCVPLGILSWLILGVPLLILGWGLGGWGDDSISPPPGFVDLTWLYFAGLELGISLLALGTAFLHRKQFALPLLNGFFGFFLDAMLALMTFSCEATLVIPSVANPGERVILFFVLNGFLLWLLFLWMRPTMLKILTRLKLARHPKAHGLP